MRQAINAAFAVLCAVLPWSPAQADGPPQVALIGFAGPLTSPFEPSARFGKSMAEAVQFAIDAANQQKIQVGGKEVRFRLLAQDDRSDLRTAPLVAEYLVKRGVIGVIGHGNTSTSIAASGIYNRAGIAQLSPSSSGRAYTEQGFDTTFRLIGHTEKGGEYLGAYMARAGLKRIAVIDNGAIAGHAFAEKFAQAARTHGVEILSQVSVSDKTSDFNGILNDAKGRNPDAIFWGGFADQAIILVQSMQRLGLAVPLVTGANGVVGPFFIEKAGSAADNVISLESGQPLERLKGWKNFQRGYEQQFGSYIDPYAPVAYDAVQVLVAAVRKADSLQPARIVAALHGIRLNGLTGQIAFNAEGDLVNPVFSIYALHHREWELIQTLDGK